MIVLRDKIFARPLPEDWDEDDLKFYDKEISKLNTLDIARRAAEGAIIGGTPHLLKHFVRREKYNVKENAKWAGGLGVFSAGCSLALRQDGINSDRKLYKSGKTKEERENLKEEIKKRHYMGKYLSPLNFL